MEMYEIIINRADDEVVGSHVDQKPHLGCDAQRDEMVLVHSQGPHTDSRACLRSLLDLFWSELRIIVERLDLDTTGLAVERPVLSGKKYALLQVGEKMFQIFRIDSTGIHSAKNDWRAQLPAS